MQKTLDSLRLQEDYKHELYDSEIIRLKEINKNLKIERQLLLKQNEEFRTKLEMLREVMLGFPQEPGNDTFGNEQKTTKSSSNIRKFGTFQQNNSDKETDKDSGNVKRGNFERKA